VIFGGAKRLDETMTHQNFFKTKGGFSDRFISDFQSLLTCIRNGFDLTCKKNISAIFCAPFLSKVEDYEYAGL
jgi:hypothetical protein